MEFQLVLDADTVPHEMVRLMVVSLLAYTSFPDPEVVFQRVGQLVVRYDHDEERMMEFPWYPGSLDSRKRVFDSGRSVAYTDGVPPALMRSRSLVKVAVGVSVIATSVLGEVMELLESNS